MRIVSSQDKCFADALHAVRTSSERQLREVQETVTDIIRNVREQGDRALTAYTKQFDGHETLVLSSDVIERNAAEIGNELRESLQRAFRRIYTYHEKQRRNSWFSAEPGGEILGQLVRPLQKVGLYVPGGKAVYPSSVLMNAVPANVAGVEEIVMVTPGSGGGVDPVICAAAEICGIQKVFQIGGAQAVAALAYGTETVPRVDKIVGPGNIFVAAAKKLVYGDVDIDMIAGPSEILVIADGTGSPAWVAADLLSQAEHDEMASALLVTTCEDFGRRVLAEIEIQAASLPKRCIAEAALRDYGAVIITKTLAEACAVANEIAPEHLELFVQDPWALIKDIKNAGAVFMGYHTAEPVGDYIAGPNHVLPTGGSARFFSPLSVDDFIKKTSILSFTTEALQAVGSDAVRLAGAEQLDAHARSVGMRLKKE